MDLFSDAETGKEMVEFTPTRRAGMQRLAQIAPRTGRHYASNRNYDFGPDQRSNVSVLSPWLRHRLITEHEVLTAVLARHSIASADKFIAEVFWRSYFKGWLEQRPSVWTSYQRDVLNAFDMLDKNSQRHDAYRNAVQGKTGIACFDHWVSELISTGYLHNHSRMWMASIWIFTLRLPWVLGADFFMRYLLDGDPASNTLSWRWVAGLHTKGKTYLARPDNIAKYTDGRFSPTGLSRIAEPLTETVEHPRIPISDPDNDMRAPYTLVLTEDDLSAPNLLPDAHAGAIGLLSTHGRSPQPVGPLVSDFARDAMAEALHPYGSAPHSAEEWSAPLIDAARRHGTQIIATAYCPIGPARSRLDKAEPALNAAGIRVQRIMRPLDRAAWPHAKAGFFGLKKKIPAILDSLGLAPPPPKNRKDARNHG